MLSTVCFIVICLEQQLQKKITSLESSLAEKESTISRLEQQNHLLSLSAGNADVQKNDHAEELKVSIEVVSSLF